MRTPFGGHAARRALLALGVAATLSSGAVSRAIEDEPLEPTNGALQPNQPSRHSVRLQDVRFGGDGSVKGVLVNQSSDVVRDVRILVRYDWRWQDERNPGEDSPGRSMYFTIAGDVPALGSLPFEYAPTPPLPVRADGTFAPAVEIAGYTEVRYKKVLRQPKSLD